MHPVCFETSPSVSLQTEQAELRAQVLSQLAHLDDGDESDK